MMPLNQSGLNKKTYSSTKEETGNGLKSNSANSIRIVNHFTFQNPERMDIKPP